MQAKLNRNREDIKRHDDFQSHASNLHFKYHDQSCLSNIYAFVNIETISTCK